MENQVSIVNEHRLQVRGVTLSHALESTDHTNYIDIGLSSIIYYLCYDYKSDVQCSGDQLLIYLYTATVDFNSFVRNLFQNK